MARIRDIILRGTRANQPLATTVDVGTLYCVTDESNIVERSTGLAWEAYSPAVGAGAINQLTGDVTAGPGSGSQAATLANTAVVAGTYGDATNSPQITVDSKGRITNVVDVPISGGGGGGDVLRAEFDLSDAEIKSLNTVPVEIVAAQGVGTLIMPISMFLVKESSAGGYSSNASFTIRYSALALDLITGFTMSLNGANKAWGRGAAAALFGLVGNTDTTVYNSALVIRSSADVTGGNVANYIKGHVIYTVLSGV